MKHQDIIDKMTLEEKAAFLSGKGEWDTRDIPVLIFLLYSVLTARMESASRQELGITWD